MVICHLPFKVVNVMVISDQLYGFHQLLSPFFPVLIHTILVNLDDWDQDGDGGGGGYGGGDEEPCRPRW